MTELGITVHTIPTDAPESDGTLEWDSTTCIVVEAREGACTGVGYTYGDESVAAFVHSQLRAVAEGCDPLTPAAAHDAMDRSIRNAGRQGVGAMALAAVDCALWDLAARLQDVPLCELLGARRDGVEAYGSGGFTSYDDDRLGEQLSGWVEDGFTRVKMKIAREPARDPQRLDVARAAAGDAELMVDANGAYDRHEAVEWGRRLRAEWDVTWLEEPVSSEDLDGLAAVRDAVPEDVAAGEYAWTLAELERTAGVVDVLQADVTRCGGITNLLRLRARPLSAHCAPALHLHPCCALEDVRHIEYFHDHVRVERMLFDGVVAPQGGVLRPDLSRPGNGLELRR